MTVAMSERRLDDVRRLARLTGCTVDVQPELRDLLEEYDRVVRERDALVLAAELERRALAGDGETTYVIQAGPNGFRFRRLEVSELLSAMVDTADHALRCLRYFSEPPEPAWRVAAREVASRLWTVIAWQEEMTRTMRSWR